jgi:predicted MPP superfamily phosphohydrolase
VRFLVNESAVVTTTAGQLRVTGVDDDLTGQPDWGKATRGIPSGERLPHIVLQHTPAWRDTLNRAFDDPRARRPLAMLSGHTHGGQADFFGWRPLLPPGSGPYVSGWYREGERKNAVPLYVSRGIGVSVLPLRFGVRPEITVFEIGG